MVCVTRKFDGIPTDYRRTKVGLIPGEWRSIRIGDLFEVTAGGDVDPTRSSEVQSASHPYPIFANGLSQEGLYGFCNYTEHRPTCITVTARGTLGTAIYRDKPFAAIGRLLVLDPKVNMDSRYFTDFINYRVRFAVESTGVPQLTAPQVARYFLPVPPKFEQCAIATVLSDVDDLIGAIEALIAKKRAIKQAVMQQLLTGRTRLPGFGGKWETRAIGDFTECLAGGTPNTRVHEYWNGAIRWMSSGELNKKWITDVVGRITDKGLRESSATIVPKRCVLIGLAGQGKTRGTVAMNLVDLCTNQSIAAVLPNRSFVPEYLYFNLDDRYEELRGMSTGDGGRGGLNLKIIRSICVPLPGIEEQSAIATVLSDMDAEIAALERRLDKTRVIKQGMMEQLLTGSIRLPIRDEATEVDANGT